MLQEQNTVLSPITFRVCKHVCNSDSLKLDSDVQGHWRREAFDQSWIGKLYAQLSVCYVTLQADRSQLSVCYVTLQAVPLTAECMLC